MHHIKGGRRYPRKENLPLVLASSLPWLSSILLGQILIYIATIYPTNWVKAHTRIFFMAIKALVRVSGTRNLSQTTSSLTHRQTIISMSRAQMCRSIIFPTTIPRSTFSGLIMFPQPVHPSGSSPHKQNILLLIYLKDWHAPNGC